MGQGAFNSAMAERYGNTGGSTQSYVPITGRNSAPPMSAVQRAEVLTLDSPQFRNSYTGTVINKAPNRPMMPDTTNNQGQNNWTELYGNAALAERLKALEEQQKAFYGTLDPSLRTDNPVYNG